MGSCGGRISAILVLFLLLLLAVVQVGLEVASQNGSHGDSNQIDPMCSTEHRKEGPESSIQVASRPYIHTGCCGS